MTFDDIAKKASDLEENKQAKMLFYLLGNMNGYFKYDFDNTKTLNKQQAVTLANDSLEAVM